MFIKKCEPAKRAIEAADLALSPASLAAQLKLIFTD
jgi:hypothetical protein